MHCLSPCVYFSRIIFKPVRESYQKQKQFITDASHELKTPLTIIEANTEVLEMDQGGKSVAEKHPQPDRANESSGAADGQPDPDG